MRECEQSTSAIIVYELVGNQREKKADNDIKIFPSKSMLWARVEVSSHSLSAACPRRVTRSSNAYIHILDIIIYNITWPETEIFC